MFEKENVKWDEVESDVKGEGNRDVREEFERCFQEDSALVLIMIIKHKKIGILNESQYYIIGFFYYQTIDCIILDVRLGLNEFEIRHQASVEQFSITGN